MRELSVGERIGRGRYEVLGEVGRGGMGIVYRARDIRLGREVALKMLVPELAKNAEAVERFEREAQAASALAHPNVITIHDIGTHRAASYIVYELLSGHTLRDQLVQGPLAADKILDYALQIASGLEAAHAREIVHRDLKPENLFITDGGRVKILDFGIARMLAPASLLPPRFGGDPVAPQFKTNDGAILGTVAYMSPEQVQGRPADHRSDIFALGSIVYEMVSGQRAFSGEPTQTAIAIAYNEPPELGPNAPAGLKKTVRRCMKKEPPDRFQSVRELESSLKALKAPAARSVPSLVAAVASAATAARDITLARIGPVLPGRVASALRGLRKPVVLPIFIVLLAISMVLLAFGLYRALRHKPPPTFQQLTLRRGAVWSARFLPDSQSIIYSAAWDGKQVQSHTVNPGKPESAPLEFPTARVLSVSRSGDLAVILEGDDDSLDYMRTGTLARVSPSGGAPRERLTHVRAADWAPGKEELAVVHDVDGISRLEFPPGTVLYVSDRGWLSHARVSPIGKIAFLEHPFYGDTRGIVMLVEPGGKARALTADFGSAMGLAWSPGGDEVWFTAGDTSQSASLRKVTLGGQQSVLVQNFGSAMLHDVAPDGRVLLAHESWRHTIRSLGPGKKEERDLSWLDYSLARELSADGRKLLFFEAGQGGGELFSAFVRDTDGSAAVLLGAGYALSLTADGQQAILGTVKEPSHLLLVPTGPGEQKTLKLPISAVAEARWFPDGKRILLTAWENDAATRRVFVLETASGKLQPLTAPLVTGQEVISKPVSSDGARVIVRRGDGYFVYPAEGGEPKRIEGLAKAQIPIAWHPDGSILVRAPGLPTKVSRLDLATGAQKPWREFMPPDPAGVSDVPWLHFAFPPAGEVYAYSYHQIVSELFLVRGVE